MPKLTIEQAHSLPAPEVRKRLEDMGARLGAKYGVTSKWSGEREVDIKATGVSGKISIEDERVRVALDLSFALTPIKGKVQERVARELRNALA